MLNKLLFETPFGEWALAQLERRGLAIVQSDWLGRQSSGPVPAVESNTGPNDKGHAPVVVIDFNTTNGSQQAEAHHTRRLLLALGWYPPKDTRGQDTNGLEETLTAMIAKLDHNDKVAIWQIVSRLYGSVPASDLWQGQQQRVEFLR